MIVRLPLAFPMFVLVSVARAVPLISYPSPSQNEAANTYSSSETTKGDQHGTEQSPLFVKVIEPEQDQQEATIESQYKKQEAANAKKTIELNESLTTATKWLVGVGILQFLVYAFQSALLLRTLKGSREQSAAMERHIKEAARQAAAMEGVVTNTARSAQATSDTMEAMKLRTAQQMRAYLYIDTGTSFPQNTQTGFRFQARVVLTNGGFTPARNIRYRIRAGICPYPLPAAFDLSPPQGVDESNFLGPRQHADLAADVDALVPEEDIERIKRGIGRSLYVWGIVTYHDIFADPNDPPRELKFCQSIVWKHYGGCLGIFLGNRCDST